MKKRKILYLFPLAALILSGCTFEEAVAGAKAFLSNNIYYPAKDFVDGLSGKTNEEEKPADEQKPAEEGEKPSEGGDKPSEGGDKPSEGGETPTLVHAGTLEDPFDGADAKAKATSLEDGAYTEEAYFVKGIVQSIDDEFNASYGNFTFSIEEGFQGYRLKNGETHEKFTDASELEVGDTVLMYGRIKLHGEKAELDGTTSGQAYIVTITKPAPEGAELESIEIGGTPKVDYIAGESYGHEGLTVTAHYNDDSSNDVTNSVLWSYSKETAELGDTTVTVTATFEGKTASLDVDVNVIDNSAPQHEGTEVDPYTGTDACIVAGKLEAGNVTEGSFYIKGVVQSFEETFNPSFGNFTFKIDGGFIGWRLKNGSSFEAFTSEDDLEIGDTVTMYAQIQNYQGKPETKGGYIVSIVKPPVEVEEVTLSEEHLELEVGGQALLSATVTPAKANQKVNWTIEQTSVVVSYEGGKVTALAAGDATIVATSVADPTKSDSCTVTVAEATKTQTGVTLSGTPKTEYLETEEYSKEGLTLTANYSDNSSEDVSELAEWTLSKEVAEYGDTELTITASYGGFSDHMDVPVNVGIKHGSQAHPYSVAEARAAVDSGENITDVYAEGYVSKIVTAYNSGYGNISFNISADGLQDGDQLQGYRTAVASADDVAVGDKVVLKGNLKKYGETYEFDAGNTIVNRVQPTAVDSVVVSGTAATTEYAAGATYSHAGLVAIATLDNGAKVDVSSVATWTISPETATVGDTEITVTATYNNVTSAGFAVAVTVTNDAPPAPTYYDATMAKGTQAYDDGTVNGKPCIKIGTSSKGGDMTITVPSGAVELKVYAVAWKGVTGLSLNITADKTGVTTDPTSIALTADDGASNSSPFTIADETPYLFTISLSGVTEQTVLTFATSAAKRCIVWGAQYRLA